MSKDSAYGFTLLFNVGQVESEQKFEDVENVDDLLDKNKLVSSMIVSTIQQKLEQEMRNILFNLEFPEFIIVDIVLADAKRIAGEV